MDKHKENSTNVNPAELERMADLIGSNIGKALDVATGSGQTAIKMAEHAGKVIAIDFTPELLEGARVLSHSKNLSNIEFIPMDVHQMDFPDESFDVVTCMFAPHHFADINTAWQVLPRVWLLRDSREQR